jgi:hypothetical protein
VEGERRRGVWAAAADKGEKCRRRLLQKRGSGGFPLPCLDVDHDHYSLRRSRGLICAKSRLPVAEDGGIPGRVKGYEALTEREQEAETCDGGYETGGNDAKLVRSTRGAGRGRRNGGERTLSGTLTGLSRDSRRVNYPSFVSFSAHLLGTPHTVLPRA